MTYYNNLNETKRSLNLNTRQQCNDHMARTARIWLAQHMLSTEHRHQYKLNTFAIKVNKCKAYHKTMKVIQYW